MPEPEPALTTAQTEKPSAVRDLLSRGRLLLLLGAFALEMVIFSSALVVPIDPSSQQSLQQAVNNLRNATNAGPLGIMTEIFTNNARVALMEMIPVFGPILFFLSIFTTGQVFQLLAISNGLPGMTYGLLLFVFPFALVELSAYAIAVGSGSMVLVAWRRKRLHSEFRVLVMEVLTVVVTLLLAAAMETVTILNPAGSLALWFPTGLLIAWLAIFLRRRSL